MTIDFRRRRGHTVSILRISGPAPCLSGRGAGAIGLILENNLIDPTAVLPSLINDLAEIEDDVYLFSRRLSLAPRFFASTKRSPIFLKHATVLTVMWCLRRAAEPPLPLATFASPESTDRD